jgi:hypothetical protein
MEKDADVPIATSPIEDLDGSKVDGVNMINGVVAVQF